MKKTKLQARIDEIHNRVQEYHKHENDPCADYPDYPEEVDAVRELKSHALKDIEFLLALLTMRDQKK